MHFENIANYFLESNFASLRKNNGKTNLHRYVIRNRMI